MWHYEYTVDDVSRRVETETFEACLSALLQVRAGSPGLSALKIFEGGTGEFGSGLKHYDSVDPVG